MSHPRTVLITGAARRIGRELALSLAKDGWDVAVHYHRSEKDAHAVCETIAGMGRRAVAVKADLNDDAAVAEIMPALLKQGVAPDCLINNASSFEKDSLADFTPAQFRMQMQTNFLAPLILMRDFAAQYKGREGNIINITDGMMGWSMSGTYLSYAVSKHALADATRMLAGELAPRIRVNAIAPGATLPGKQDEEQTFEKLAKIIPLGRVSAPEEIAATVRYILAAHSMTGQILALSGGMDLVG